MKRAIDAGVSRMMMPNIDIESIERISTLANEYPAHCFPMMGLHPCSVKENYQVELRMIEDWLTKKSFAAVGEIGLDYYWDLSFKYQQIEAFDKQIQLSIQYNLPIVIHSRNSLDDCI